MELVEKNPNVLYITEYAGFLDMLLQKNAVLNKINAGLDTYVDKKRLTFSRYRFICIIKSVTVIIFTHSQVFLLVPTTSSLRTLRNQRSDSFATVAADSFSWHMQN
jgi:hypothetical protein